MLMKKKIVKEKGESPSEFEGQVAQVRVHNMRAVSVARARGCATDRPGDVDLASCALS
jgi:hypothetical protein